MKTKLKVISNIIMYTLVLIFNYLTAVGLINGMNQKAVSEKFPTIITPANYAFSIWGVIYVLLFSSLIYLLTKSNKLSIKNYVSKIWILVNVGALSNILWTIAFAYLNITQSSILILILLVSLVMILKCKLNNKLINISFGIYTGWVLLATLVNILANIQAFNINTLTYPFLIIALFASSILVLFVIKITDNYYILISVIWALTAVYAKNQYFETLISLIIILIISLYMFSHLKNRKSLS